MIENKRNYYAIIPANVRYDNELNPNAKLLYGEITALCNEKGYCWSNNDYFSKLYNVSKTSISKWINLLVEKKYIKSEILYKENSKEIIGRHLYILNTPIEDNFNTPIEEKLNTPIEEKLKDNNTLNNNVDNNIIIKEKFEKFYSEYPRKVKKDLVRKWFIKNKPSDELFEIMMSSLYKFKKTYDWIKENGKYIPYPSSWLNEKRWEDEIEEMKEKEKEGEPVVEIFDYDWLNDGEQE